MSVPEGYKSLGKIGISYKGDYNSNTAYERLDAVFHNGSTYLAIKDAPDGAPRDDKTNWIYLAKGYDGETVDVADSEIAFTDSETRENIVSGEKVSTVFGKIKKFFTDLTAPAFAQMITTKEDLLATKVTGYVPDAKAVADTYTELNRKLEPKLLWTNPDNTAAFNAQTIELDLSIYSRVIIEFKFAINTDYYEECMAPIDGRYHLGHVVAYRIHYRGFTPSAAGIIFDTGVEVYDYGKVTKYQNDAVPNRIYGVM